MVSRRALLALSITGAAGAAFVGVGCSLSAPRWRGPLTDHFDGRRFRSIEPLDHGFSDFWRWITHRESGFWPDFVDAPPGPKPPERVGGGRLLATFVNHATVLLQMDGINLLTDPVWSERVSPFSFVGPRRHRPAGIRLEDLPPLDAILVSHNHYDHMDVATLRRLEARRPVPIFVALNNARYLAACGVGGARDLDWWQSAPLAAGVEVTVVPARHFSSRGPFDRDRALWGGFVVKGPSGSVYFAGDTGWGSHFARIRERLGPPRLALLPIGAYRPRWFMAAAHIDPEEAVRAHETLGAGTSLAVHFGTFAQADDGIDEPEQALREALARRSNPPRFLRLDNGQSAEIPPLE